VKRSAESHLMRETGNINIESAHKSSLLKCEARLNTKGQL